MTLPIIWKLEARREFVDLIQYIGERSPVAANAMFEAITSAVVKPLGCSYILAPGRTKEEGHPQAARILDDLAKGPGAIRALALWLRHESAACANRRHCKQEWDESRAHVPSVAPRRYWKVP